MGMVMDMVLEDKGEEWRELMESVREQEGEVTCIQEMFLERKGVEDVGGSTGVKVKTINMQLGEDWYNYQLQVREGRDIVEVFREDGQGVHKIHGGVMVLTYWGGTESAVVLREGQELQEFWNTCDRFNPPIDYCTLDDPSLLFPD